MKKNLTAPQWVLYESERQKREENRKLATVRYFVDSLDRELYLTPEQCKTLDAALKERWEPAWTMYLENHLLGNKYYPMTVDPLVTPILTDAQQKVWRGVQKLGIYWGLGLGGVMNGFANDQDDLEVELGEPARRAKVPNRAFPAMKIEIEGLRGQRIEAALAASKKEKAAIKARATVQKKAAAPEPATGNAEKKAGQSTE